MGAKGRSFRAGMSVFDLDEVVYARCEGQYLVVSFADGKTRLINLVSNVNAENAFDALCDSL